MPSVTRTVLGQTAAALLLFAACSEPSTPDPKWSTGVDDDTNEGWSGNRGGALGMAGARDESRSGSTGAGGALSAAGSSGSADPDGSAGTAVGGKGGSAGTAVGGNGGNASRAGSGGTGRAGSPATGGKAGASSAGRGASPGAAGELGSSGQTGSAGEGPTGDDFFGDSRCSNDLDFCDGFEGNALRNVYKTQGAVPTLDSTRAARGSKSAHFTATGNGLSLLRYAFAARQSYYGRLFVWFEALPTAPKWAHWTIAGATGNGTEAEIRVGGQFDGSTNRFGVGTDHGETGDWTMLSEEQDEVPERQWICVEWFHDGDTNEIRFWSDEVEHTSLHATATQHGGEGTFDVPEFTEVFVGWWHYQMNPTPNRFDVWIDELAIDDERIGCTR